MPTTEALRLRPAAELGPVLTGRSVAEKMRRRIEAAATSDEVVEVDFAGVTTASPSFADELFAKLPPELIAQGRIRFANVPASLDRLVRFLVRQRHGSPRSGE